MRQGIRSIRQRRPCTPANAGDACAATAAGRWALPGPTAVKYSSIQAALKLSTWLMLRSTMPAARAVSMRTARCAVSLQPASQPGRQAVSQKRCFLPYFKTTGSLQDRAHAAAGPPHASAALLLRLLPWPTCHSQTLAQRGPPHHAWTSSRAQHVVDDAMLDNPPRSLSATGPEVAGCCCRSHLFAACTGFKRRLCRAGWGRRRGCTAGPRSIICIVSCDAELSRLPAHVGCVDGS